MEQLETKKIFNLFSNHSNKLSYSKFKNFTTCELSWFYSNFVETDQKEINQNFALPGTIIQRIFEEIINKQIYKGRSEKDFNDWIIENTKGLFELIQFNIEDQLKIKNDYFHTEEGIEKIIKIKEKYPLYQIDSGISPNFIEIQSFLKNFDSLSCYVSNLIDIIIKNTRTFNSELSLDIKGTVSEVYLKSQYGNLTISGKIDFIEKDYTKEDYFIFDGKMTVNDHTDIGQLIFYAYLINKQYDTFPYKAGFFSWNTQKFKQIEISKNDLYSLEKNLEKYIERIEYIKKAILNITSDYISIDILNNLLNYSSSFSNCRFCLIKNVCKKAYK